MTTAISRTKTSAPGGRRSPRPDRSAWGFLLPFVALFLFTFVLPLGYAVYQSLLKPIRSGPLGLGPATVGFAGLDNYSLALQQSAFLEGFARVLLFGLVQIPVMLLLSTALALALDTVSHRWAGVLRAAYFLPYGAQAFVVGAAGAHGPHVGRCTT
jgi:multiple sugar transport system permease protein